MLETITNILNKQLYPLNVENIQEPHIYKQRLQDVEKIKPVFVSVYQIYFPNFQFIPPKAEYYFCLINNDIAYLLNTYIAKQNENPTDARIAYWHRQVKNAIDGIIYHYYKTIKNNNLSLKEDETIGFSTDNRENQMFALICYYAISALACAYLQWLSIFKDKLPDIELYAHPYEYIYSVTFVPLPQEIQIRDTTVQDNNQILPKGGNTYNMYFQDKVNQVIGNAGEVNTKQDE